MAEKHLIVKSSNLGAQGKTGVWNDITDQMSLVTKNIIIPDINDDDTNAIGSVLSGTPTIFARANVFKLAFDCVQDKDAETSGLMTYYKSLISEWRGFVSCIALDYASISTRRIELRYSDGKDLAHTENLYEPTGAFGNLLFDKRVFWCDPNLGANEEKVPFIDVITYKDSNNGDIIVGGTSPESFLFTSVGYELSADKPFINRKTHKFVDPLESNLNEEQLLQLYAYITHLYHAIGKYNNYFSSIPKDKLFKNENICGNLEDWLGEMKDMAAKNHWNLENASTPQVDRFQKPFSILFNYKLVLFGEDGIIYDAEDDSDNDNDNLNRIRFNPRELLLDNSAVIARIDCGKDSLTDPNFAKKANICLLRANIIGKSGSFQYFALPLTSQGLRVFGKNLEALVGIAEGNNVQSRLTAEVDLDAEKFGLTVKLRLFTKQGKQKDLEEKYSIGQKAIMSNDVIVWPNFIAKQWNKYYMYSEMPHNTSTTKCPFSAVPLVGDMFDEMFPILVDDKGAPIELAKNGRIVIEDNYKDKIKAKLHVVSDNRIADNDYKYEIYESNQPFKGVRLSNANRESGYAIIRYDQQNSNLPKNYLYDTEMENLPTATVGVDFGSTNTSVAYRIGNEVPHGVTIHNRRVRLFDSCIPSNPNRPARENELFFFQQVETQGNGIKSILSIHDTKRLAMNDQSRGLVSVVEKPVAGGFPCFEKNLPVDDVTDTRYKLNFKGSSGAGEMVYNMKWSQQEIEKSYKKAFLSSLLLHVYAEMFTERCRPAKLKWSYPSSMGSELTGQYNAIWSDMSNINPILLNVQPTNIQVAQAPIVKVASANTFGMPGGGLNQPSGFGQQSGFSQFGAFGQPISGGFGQPAQSGFGQPEQPCLDQNVTSIGSQSFSVQKENKTIKFNFGKLLDDNALTEACAVANFIVSQDIEKTPNNLTLVFDVGGSTTDISALCMMQGPDGNQGIAMVKQNSIRFAAQRISYATRYSKNIRQVLLELCEKKNIKIQGLNTGTLIDKPEMAPYFYDMVLDRLAPADLSEMYQLMRAKCPDLMMVDLYVTGLIMYYAGQLTNKLVRDLRNTDPTEQNFTIKDSKDNWKPFVNIVFTGKGSRIFEWLLSIDQQAHQNYYYSQYLCGVGRDCYAQFIGNYPNILPPSALDASNVKYEVSKGLTYEGSTLLIPDEKTAPIIEMIGEEGFILHANGVTNQLHFDDGITPEMMQQMGKTFMCNPQNPQIPCPKFAEFLWNFRESTKNMFGINIPDQQIMQGLQSMNINSYIVNLPEFADAMKKVTPQNSGGLGTFGGLGGGEQVTNEKFGFVAPIIILEGMKFYDDFLMRYLQR